MVRPLAKDGLKGEGKKREMLQIRERWDSDFLVEDKIIVRVNTISDPSFNDDGNGISHRRSENL